VSDQEAQQKTSYLLNDSLVRCVSPRAVISEYLLHMMCCLLLQFTSASDLCQMLFKVLLLRAQLVDLTLNKIVALGLGHKIPFDLVQIAH